MIKKQLPTYSNFLILLSMQPQTHVRVHTHTHTHTPHTCTCTHMHTHIYVCQCFMSPYFFLTLQDKEQQSHSLPVILIYLIFLTAAFRDAFKSLGSKIYEKPINRSYVALREVSDNNLKFSKQRAPGNTFSCILPTYVAIIMTNYFKLHYFNLFLRLFYCIISSFLYFRMISERNYGRYMWMGLTPSQV